MNVFDVHTAMRTIEEYMLNAILWLIQFANDAQRTRLLYLYAHDVDGVFAYDWYVNTEIERMPT